MNLTFYPGPSKLYPSVEKYLAEAYQSGILSMNHRSEAFMELLASTISFLHQKLEIPDDYEVYFTSSATECWEIIAQSLIRESSLHIYNGAFGQKWFEYTRQLHPNSTGQSFDLNEEISFQATQYLPEAEVLCLTHNETSNATAVNQETFLQIRQEFDGVIAVDATSSMAGVVLPWSAADVWFASVQKCFGLPPGLGVLVVSPRAVQKAMQQGDRRYYNSLLFVRENFLKNQTPYTPNILAIYLLGRVMRDVPLIQEIDEQTRQRAAAWYRFLMNHPLEILVENPLVRSQTVIAFRGQESFIKSLRKWARAEGIILGSGYGEWKNTSIRIANFPALSPSDISRLMDFLENNI